MNARPNESMGFIFITDYIQPEHNIIVVPKKGRHEQLKLALENEVAQSRKVFLLVPGLFFLWRCSVGK